MEFEMFVVLAIIAIAVGAVITHFVYSLDSDRIGNYIEERGGKLLESKHRLFEPGWRYDEDERVFWVRYQDSDDNIHEAFCKTRIFGNVFFTDDKIVEYAAVKQDKPSPDQTYKDESSRAELERLKEENEFLRRELEKNNGPLIH